MCTPTQPTAHPPVPLLAGFVLDSPLVLLYHCLLSHPFQIVSWAEWGRALASLNKQEQ